MKPTLLLQYAAVIAVASLPAANPAIAAPDAGSQIRRYQDETQQRLAPRPRDDKAVVPTVPSRSSAAAAASSAKVHVRAFEVQGVTRFSLEEIAAVLAAYVGKDLDTAGIHAAADALNAHYRNAGYFASKVFIPPQDVVDVIRLDVYEGYLDDTDPIEVVNTGRRIDVESVRRILDANLPRKDPLHRADYERALLIAEDLPGITTFSTLYPGREVGTARLRTIVKDLPLWAGNVDADNFGSESTGTERLGTTIYLNSPGKVGDQAVLRAVTSGHRSSYGYLAYMRPLSAYGTRWGASADYFRYDADFIANLGYSSGNAHDLRVYLTHPVVRSRKSNLSVRADASRLELEDRNDLPAEARRKIDTLVLAVHGDDEHDWLGAGMTVVDASVTSGSVAIRGNDSYVAVDRATADTGGSFTRMNFNVSRLQSLGGAWSMYLRVLGQWASGNLDNSQKFYLGGATSLPGYPLAEIGGDQGIEAFGEVRYDVLPPWRGTLTLGAFYDQGWARLHKDPWPGWQGTNPIIENQVTIRSAGFSAVQVLPHAWVVRALVGWQVGDNPVRDPVSGNASDGKSRRFRAWWQVIRYF